MAEPTEDRWHETPTALMGGIAIWAGALAGWAAAPAGDGTWALWAGGTILFLSGLADDLRGLTPVAKVVAQVAGGLRCCSWRAGSWRRPGRSGCRPR